MIVTLSVMSHGVMISAAVAGAEVHRGAVTKPRDRGSFYSNAHTQWK